MTDYPDLTCGDNYLHNNEIFNVFGKAIHKDNGEELVIMVDRTDTVYAISASEFFSLVDDKPAYKRISDNLA